jgi:cysteine desulfurase / selenocysteine lyase
MNKITTQFPFFQNNPGIAYLDSAATTQKPCYVIDKVNQYLIKTSNPGRNGFGLSSQVQSEIEEIRCKVVVFLGIELRNFAFCRGATHAMNTIVRSLASHILEDGDEILLCQDDHKATILPWTNLAILLGQFNINIKIVSYKTDPFCGLIDVEDLLAKINCHTKFVIMTHAHNIFGVVNDIQSITKKLPKDVITVLDIAQSIGHIDVDLAKIGVDLAVFSGHKMFALESIGGLFASNKVKPWFKQSDFGGGAHILSFPHILEVGTQNTVGIISLGAAIDFIEKIGLQNIQPHCKELVMQLYNQLQALNNIDFLPGIAFDKGLCSTGIICFESSLDLDFLQYQLDKSHINIRIGKHCTQNTLDSVRVSFHIYNQSQDIQRLMKVLN